MLVRVGCILLALVAPVVASTFTVTTGADSADGVCDAHCSLREAISAANAHAGADRIALPAGTVSLSLPGRGENDNARGDLDVTGELLIAGAGARRTLIDAQRLDRVVHGINAHLEIEDLALRRGRLRGDTGAGVALQGGTLVLRRVSVRDCATDTWGGGVYVGAGDLQVIASTIADNRASRGGGLYYQGFTRQLQIESSTISGNRAAAGGGLFIDQECGFAAPCAIVSSTIAANAGGGLHSAAGTFSLALGGVLLAGNGGGNCAPGSGRSLGYNLDDDGSCPLTRPSDRRRARAGLLSLRDGGGPTDTHPLDAASAARDAGDPATCPPRDQRGQERLGRCDIGAHEATAGVCGDGVLDRDESCDGADPCCTARCIAMEDGAPCADDGDPCTADRCIAGRCRHGAAADTTCRRALRDELAVGIAGDIRWRWTRGAATAPQDFAVPAGTSALCIYDGDRPELLAGVSLPAGRAHWRAAGDGFQFRGPAVRAVLHPGGDGRARLAVQAGGAVLAPDVGTPLRVEWRAAGGRCWASELAAADIVRADDTRLVARRRD